MSGNNHADGHHRLREPAKADRGRGGWGRTGVEFDFSDGLGCTRSQRSINLVNKTSSSMTTTRSAYPTRAMTSFNPWRETKVRVVHENRPFVMQARQVRRLGAMAEIFGMPQRVGKYSMYDTGTRQILEQALANAGSAPYIDIPRETDVETVNNTGSGSSGASYGEFRKACNEEILITVLGQTLTTIQGDKGARSLGEVHKEVENRKTEPTCASCNGCSTSACYAPRATRLPREGRSLRVPGSAEQLSVNELSTLSVAHTAIVLVRQVQHTSAKDNEPVAGSNPGRRTMERQPGNHERGRGRGQENANRETKNQKRLRDFKRSPRRRSGAG